jgi:hypothetical protein
MPNAAHADALLHNMLSSNVLSRNRGVFRKPIKSLRNPRERHHFDAASMDRLQLTRHECELLTAEILAKLRAGLGFPADDSIAGWVWNPEHIEPG